MKINKNFRKEFINNRPTHQIWGSKGGVTTMDPIATNVGIDILNKGGNAIDASIAIATTLAVTSPNWSGLAGDSAWLYHDGKKNINSHIDGYSVCPKKIETDKFCKLLKLKKNSYIFKEEPVNVRNSGIATAMIPGTPFLLDYAWQKFGSLKFKNLINPSIKLAKEGFPISEYLFEAFKGFDKKILKFNTTKKLIKNNEKIKIGSTFKQNDLAKTLLRFSINKSREFRDGQTVNAILKYCKNKNPFFSLEDFQRYKVLNRKTYYTNFKKSKIVTTGLPTSGINLLQCFELLKKYDLKNIKFMSKKYLDILISILQIVLKNRRQFSADPDFINFNQKNLLSNKYIKSILKNLNVSKDKIKINLEDGGTTHFCVWDKNNNIVSATQSIGYQFGCGEIAGNTGLFMNDRTWWMAINKSPNMIQPNKRCNIGHAPIIVFKNNKPYLTVGSPGGFGIIQYLFQVMSHVLNYGIDLQTAIDLPRFRVSNNFKDVFIEERFKSLSKNKNYNIKSFSEWTDIVGGVEGIVKNPSGNYLNCYDVRRNSQASGFF
ncbi:gamma-glutamyltransferase [Candidatus Pelagibacter sp.]|nr:gamma-glutamyltransferase [Candidatus Pelagibacter sp.]